MAYARRLIANGFSLKDDVVYEMQLLDLMKALGGRIVSREKDLRFLLGFMHRISVDETISDMRRVRHDLLSMKNG